MRQFIVWVMTISRRSNFYVVDLSTIYFLIETCGASWFYPVNSNGAGLRALTFFNWLFGRKRVHSADLSPKATRVIDRSCSHGTHLHFTNLFMNAYLFPTDIMNLSPAIQDPIIHTHFLMTSIIKSNLFSVKFLYPDNHQYNEEASSL